MLFWDSHTVPNFDWVTLNNWTLLINQLIFASLFYCDVSIILCGGHMWLTHFDMWFYIMICVCLTSSVDSGHRWANHSDNGSSILAIVFVQQLIEHDTVASSPNITSHFISHFLLYTSISFSTLIRLLSQSLPLPPPDKMLSHTAQRTVLGIPLYNIL